MKRSGYENCGLCGLAHFGNSRTCPHLQSETQVRLMLDALKTSTESQELIDAAQKYLRGVLGDLIKRKRKQRESLLVPMNEVSPHFPPNPSVPATFNPP
jgi:chromodomain-helicase-DNA-binding protein 4